MNLNVFPSPWRSGSAGVSRDRPPLCRETFLLISCSHLSTAPHYPEDRACLQPGIRWGKGAVSIPLNWSSLGRTVPFCPASSPPLFLSHSRAVKAEPDTKQCCIIEPEPKVKEWAAFQEALAALVCAWVITHRFSLSVCLLPLLRTWFLLLMFLAGVHTIFYQPVLQDSSENVFWRCCSYKEPLPLIFLLPWGSFCFAFLYSGRVSVLPPFPQAVFSGSPALAASPCMAWGICDHFALLSPLAASLLLAAEVVLAGAWLVILSEICFRLRIMMEKKKKKLIFFIIGFPLFPEELMTL